MSTMPDASGDAPRSLADDLRGRSDAALTALLRARPDLASPLPADLTQLATRAGTRSSVLRALDRLDRFSLQVLDVAAVLPEPASYDAVRALLRSDEADIRRTVDRLVEQALLWGGPDGLRVVRAAGDVVGGAPAGLGPPVAALLGGLAPSRVQDILADLGLSATPDAVSGAAAVAGLFGDPAALAALLAGAPQQARALLDELTWGPPAGEVRNAARSVRAADARTAVDWLLARGLLVPAGPTMVVLPREVGLHLRGRRVHRQEEPQPPTVQVARHEPALVARTAAAMAFAAVRAVEDLCEAWSLAPPVVLRTGGLGVRDLRSTATLLDLPERQTAVTVETAYVAGLLGPSGDHDEVWLPTPAYDAWHRQPVAQRWAALAEAWLDTTRVAGLVGGKDERGRTVNALGPDLDRAVAADVRHGVLAELAAHGPGAAVPAADIVARLRWARPRRSSQSLDDLVGWTLAEAEWLGITGRGALASHALPLLSAGQDVAAAAAAAATALAPHLPRPLDAVLLQADLTAVAPGPLEPDLARELALLADVESTGGATVYRFSEASVRRAFDAGRTAAEVVDLLSRHSRTPVPQPLRYLVEDVGRRHGQVRVGSASAYVRCDDEALLGAVVADRRAAQLRLRRIAPTVLAAQAPVDVVLARLREMGYAPAAEAPDGALLLQRPDVRRGPARQRPPRLVVDPPVPHDDLLTATVRALRAGDRASRVASERAAAALDDGPPPVALRRSPPVQTLAVLQEAAAAGRSLWIGYVDNAGTTSERVVDPLRVEHGYLTAYDHRREAVRTFAVHRITGVADLGSSPTGPASRADASQSSP